MKALAGVTLTSVALAAGLSLSVSSVPASAQGFSAVSLLMHSSIVSRCEGRELTQAEATKTAIGFSDMWRAMRDCRANMARREAAAATAAVKKK